MYKRIVDRMDAVKKSKILSLTYCSYMRFGIFKTFSSGNTDKAGVVNDPFSQPTV